MVHTPSSFLLEARKRHADGKDCFLYKLVKGDISDIMDSEENLGEIFMLFLISFILTALVSNRIFSCV